MNAKLQSILLLVAAVALVAGGLGYGAHMESRARRLEARLARVEAALNGKPVAAVPTSPRGRAAPAQIVTMPQFSAPAVEQSGLESRVENLEREMSPHLELLPPALSGDLTIGR